MKIASNAIEISCKYDADYRQKNPILQDDNTPPGKP